MNKTLITGNRGFLGSALMQHLKSEVVTFDLRLSETNRDQWSDFLRAERPTVIFHCAGRVFSSEQNQLTRDNVESTGLLLSVLKELDYQGKVVIPGSAAEYGPQDSLVGRISEKAICNPQTTYGKSKLQQTELAVAYSKKGLHVSVARIFNILSRNASPMSAIGSFRKQLMASCANQYHGDKHKIFVGSLASIRDYLWIDDVLSSLLVLSQNAESGEIYNVCSGEPRSMEQILNKMIQKSGVNVDVIVSEKNLRSSELEYSCGDNTKLKSLGWKPQVTFDYAIELLMSSESS